MLPSCRGISRDDLVNFPHETSLSASLQAQTCATATGTSIIRLGPFCARKCAFPFVPTGSLGFAHLCLPLLAEVVSVGVQNFRTLARALNVSLCPGRRYRGRMCLQDVWEWHPWESYAVTEQGGI
ncbi:unnamed protein product [Protopolystoma xenopodis]|uniref:Uncharacterized protein n=1 Tax=Protopolystoma xenopodis TaxID=117903 RepID=A0A3S5CIV1_9PLAT|nr:unnamed protein product [Protopolystoma xenopodis]